MEPEGSLPHSQVPATCPYPEPARFSSYLHIPLSEDPSSAKSNLYLANSLGAAVNEPALYRLLTFQIPNLMSLFLCLDRTKESVQARVFVCEYYVTKYVLTGRSC